MAEKKNEYPTEFHLYFVLLKAEDVDKPAKRLVCQLDRPSEDELFLKIGGDVYYGSFSQVSAIMDMLVDRVVQE